MSTVDEHYRRAILGALGAPESSIELLTALVIMLESSILLSGVNRVMSSHTSTCVRIMRRQQKRVRPSRSNASRGVFPSGPAVREAHDFILFPTTLPHEKQRTGMSIFSGGVYLVFSFFV